MYHIFDYMILSTSNHFPISEFLAQFSDECCRYSEVFDVFRENDRSAYGFLDVHSLLFRRR